MRKLLLLLVATLAAAQTKATKPFTPPPAGPIDPGWFFGGPLMKDEGCAKDFVKSETMEGLDKRKYIAELVTYGCGIQLRGVYVAQALESKTFTAGAKTMVFRHVFLTNTEFSKLVYGASDTAKSREGWIPQSAISRDRLTPKQMVEIASKLGESSK